MTSASLPRPGGVDPLGLRQINFDLMDQVFPGVNNIARHIRPFVVVAWAWRRAAQIAARGGVVEIRVEELRDFVDRIEVLFVWSQFLVDRTVALPGSDVLAPYLTSQLFPFSGPVWARQKETRRLSTGLSAPINYGPALRSLGWLEEVPDASGAMRVTQASTAAIDALEARLAPFLDHPAFSILGEMEVRREDALAWADAWGLTTLTAVERQTMATLLAGSVADPKRAAGVSLALAAMSEGAGDDVTLVRRSMCGPPSDFQPPEALEGVSAAWRRTQVRQLFRLALEVLFAWALRRLEDRPLPTGRLVARMLDTSGGEDAETTTTWLAGAAGAGQAATDLIAEIETALTSSDWSDVPSAVRRALALCLSEAPQAPEGFERLERLPLAVAARQAEGLRSRPPSEFLRHVFEVWLFGQHTFWSVGRGLSDARAAGRTLLRLRVVLEEGGWALAPNARASRPNPTPDRLATILSLAREAGLITHRVPGQLG
ncbi:MAG: hypothetical protein Q8Q88_21950 [Phenylobacterium sp.]|uniref:hypothetical protein n=1 Tax=Phenylobacterium sp. TaxID=1871053 RepID=UPI0027371238|nr:hypothetical protein [Phenylobacterium sp.]MDP3749703.1 hypothetical protein [Phenylobacterium sp.]